MLEKQQKRYKRHRRLRAKIFGTAKSPRLCVFRSANHIYAQLIDDEKGKTLLSASDLEIKKLKIKTENSKPHLKIQKAKETKSDKIAIAYKVGRLIAKRALEKKIEKVVFDRGGYLYHGRIKSLAEGARKEGIKF